MIDGRIALSSSIIYCQLNQALFCYICVGKYSFWSSLVCRSQQYFWTGFSALIQMLDEALLLLSFVSFILTTCGQSLTDIFPKELELTFVGESLQCGGIFAQVEVKDDFQEVNQQEIITAVAQSFAIVEDDSGNAIAAAQSTAEKVLEVTAEAVATIDAKINSPAVGCWAIAFGRAEAVAIATAVVEAIAEGITQAVGEQVSADAFARAEDKQQSVAEAIATVALLLVQGDGSGEQTGSGRAVATAKAVAVNCALAQAYAQVIDGTEAEIVALVNAGCPEEDRTTVAPSRSPGFACECVGNERGFPRDCGPWGGANNICFVNNPNSCQCSVASTLYDGQSWRFCGSTLKDMKTYLSFSDSQNNITQTQSGYGYCANWNPDWDWELPVPSPPPPSPSPPPPSPPPPSPKQTPTTIPTVTCPRVRCFGTASDCCNIQDPALGELCSLFRGFRVYEYIGKCQNGRDVWNPEIGVECYCS
eukprot:TRINITY_DN9823_c0_g1_i1.p1 TRINITY_DN9823_c0_g1~~TRINITY_DN9823_c0_g1_i1.p1  ORF type:complete len:476 (+),score=41.34 TRINITY_DN9823_c0_g1_i1:2-1429(+)